MTAESVPGEPEPSPVGLAHPLGTSMGPAPPERGGTREQPSTAGRDMGERGGMWERRGPW